MDLRMVEAFGCKSSALLYYYLGTDVCFGLWFSFSLGLVVLRWMGDEWNGSLAQGE